MEPDYHLVFIFRKLVHVVGFSPAVMLVYGIALALLAALVVIWDDGRKRPRMMLLTLASCALGTAVVVHHLDLFQGVFFGQAPRESVSLAELATILCWGLVWPVLVPFAHMFYRKWLGGECTQAENRPGREGFHAWLRWPNVAMCVAIALFAWQGYDYPFWLVLGIAVGALLAYPTGVTLMQTNETPRQETADVPAQRERVMRMVEDCKITAAEGAELLNALGDSARPPAPARPALSRARVLLLAGAGLVLVGFFLPWFRINLGRELGQMAEPIMGEQMQQRMKDMARRQGMPMPDGTPGLGNMSGNFSFNTGTITISGSRVAHGLGVVVLLMAAAAAVTPFVTGAVGGDKQRLAMLLMLGLGAIILIYVISDAIRFASVGLLVVAGGYVVEFFGAFTEGRSGRLVRG